MLIGIHNSKWGFSQFWIKYCEEKNIPFKIVNCYDSDIVSQLADCDILMWHHHHTLAKDYLFAKQLLYSLEAAGKKVFPDFHTSWHFDDKLGQKYLLEAVNAPLVPSYAFYSEKEALAWIDNTVFPKVFKLRGGAGSANVKLARTPGDARNFVRKAFGKGFSAYDKFGNLKEEIRKFKIGKNSLLNVLKSIRRIFLSTNYAKVRQRERGYVLFQDFIPNNKFDIRVITIGDKAFAIKRMVRENDFRASGSGNTLYAKDEMDERCIVIAFQISEKIKGQCVAYDFVFDEKNIPLIVEINYGFAYEVYLPCVGYWDKNLNWYQGNFNPMEWMVDLVVHSK